MLQQRSKKKRRFRPFFIIKKIKWPTKKEIASSANAIEGLKTTRINN